MLPKLSRKNSVLPSEGESHLLDKFDRLLAQKPRRKHNLSINEYIYIYMYKKKMFYYCTFMLWVWFAPFHTYWLYNPVVLKRFCFFRTQTLHIALLSHSPLSVTVIFTFSSHSCPEATWQMLSPFWGLSKHHQSLTLHMCTQARWVKCLAQGTLQ